MTKTKTINPDCPTCEGQLTMYFSEEDDTEYIIDNEITLSVQCWECNLTGSATFKLTNLDIETEDE